MLDPRIRFRHLRAFVETARQHAVGRAASVLGVTQPAVSKSLRELEDILGVRLFEPEGRGVRLTRRGQVFLEAAGASLAALQQGVDRLAGEDSESPLRIGALPSVSARLMPAVIANFLDERVRARLELVTGDNAALLEHLRLGRLDLVIGRLASPEMMAGFDFVHLYSEPVRFVVRDDHPLLAAVPFDFGLLRAYPVLIPAAGSIIRPLVDRYLLSQGQGAFPRAIETISQAFGRAFVLDTDAVWIISEGVVARDLADGTLAALPVVTADTSGAVGITTSTGIPPSAARAILMQLVHRHAQRLAG